MEPIHPPENNPQKNEAPTTIGGLKGIGFGLLFLGIAYYFFSTMTRYEGGEGVSMNSILLIAYKILGKNISTGILGVIGGLLTFSGIKEIISANK